MGTELQRNATNYRFTDPDMDFIFQWVLGTIRTGGLDAGELFHLAAGIPDGDADAWSTRFAEHGDNLNELADRWLQRGHRLSAGEVRMKAYSAYRWAWQFSNPQDENRFVGLIRAYEGAFATAVSELELPMVEMAVPYAHAHLPGYYLSATGDAPTLLVIGGGDTGREDLYHLVGASAWHHGYNVAMVDLPGQGSTPLRGLHLTVEAELPMTAIVDYLIERHGTDPRRLAVVGFSGGGYFTCRAITKERRFAAAAASMPISDLSVILPVSAVQDMATRGAMARNFRIHLWRANVATAREFATGLAESSADPAEVRCPFLTLIGTGESAHSIRHAEQWHEALPVDGKAIVYFDAATGADAHCQLNNPIRMAQELCNWLDELLKIAPER